MAALAGTLAPALLPLAPRAAPHPGFPNRNALPSRRPRGPRLAVARAASGGGNGGDGGGPLAEGEEDKEASRGRPSLPALSEIRWGELLSPEPSNAAAVVLTGVLAWAGSTLLLQLALIIASIFAAAVKYSFIAAVLLFVLIALL